MTSILRQLDAQNQQLSVYLRKTASRDAASVALLRSSIRANLEKLLVEHYDIAQQRNVEAALWKECIYASISDFRQELRALASKDDDRAQKRLVKVTTAFHDFLDECMELYRRLVDHFKHVLSHTLTAQATRNPVPSTHSTTATVDALEHQVTCTLGWCLIYLGDLARYREMYSAPAQAPGAANQASSYYRQAAVLMPWSGHPHNQLAVLASYHDHELAALYQYCRSLMAERPFPSVLDNMVGLLEKNRRAVATLESRSEIRRLASLGANALKIRRNTPPAKQQEIVHLRATMFDWVLRRFVRCAGMVVTRTSLEQLPSTVHVMGKDMLRLLYADAMPHIPIVQMLGVAIALVAFISETSQGYGTSEVEVKRRDVHKAYAVLLAKELAVVIAQATVRRLREFKSACRQRERSLPKTRQSRMSVGEDSDDDDNSSMTGEDAASATKSRATTTSSSGGRRGAGSSDRGRSRSRSETTLHAPLRLRQDTLEAVVGILGPLGLFCDWMHLNPIVAAGPVDLKPRVVLASSSRSRGSNVEKRRAVHGDFGDIAFLASQGRRRILDNLAALANRLNELLPVLLADNEGSLSKAHSREKVNGDRGTPAQQHVRSSLSDQADDEVATTSSMADKELAGAVAEAALVDDGDEDGNGGQDEDDVQMHLGQAVALPEEQEMRGFRPFGGLYDDLMLPGSVPGEVFLGTDAAPSAATQDSHSDSSDTLAAPVAALCVGDTAERRAAKVVRLVSQLAHDPSCVVQRNASTGRFMTKPKIKLLKPTEPSVAGPTAGKAFGARSATTQSSRDVSDEVSPAVASKTAKATTVSSSQVTTAKGKKVSTTPAAAAIAAAMSRTAKRTATASQSASVTSSRRSRGSDAARRSAPNTSAPPASTVRSTASDVEVEGERIVFQPTMGDSQPTVAEAPIHQEDHSSSAAVAVVASASTSASGPGSGVVASPTHSSSPEVYSAAEAPEVPPSSAALSPLASSYPSSGLWMPHAAYADEVEITTGIGPSAEPSSGSMPQTHTPVAASSAQSFGAFQTYGNVSGSDMVLDGAGTDVGYGFDASASMFGSAGASGVGSMAGAGAALFGDGGGFGGFGFNGLPSVDFGSFGGNAAVGDEPSTRAVTQHRLPTQQFSGAFVGYGDAHTGIGAPHVNFSASNNAPGRQGLEATADAQSSHHLAWNALLGPVAPWTLLHGEAADSNHAHG